jgi:hypothetical protein
MKSRYYKTLHKIFEARTFQEFFEINHEVWLRIQAIAKTKGYLLTDYELRTQDGKTLVDLNSDDSWNQLLTLLGLEDLKDEPIRSININRFSTLKAYPKSNIYKIKIEGDLGAEELPDEDQIKEILTANLAPIDGRIQGKVKVTKQDANIIIVFNAVTKEEEDDEIKKYIQTNFDKIVTVKNVSVKKL